MPDPVIPFILGNQKLDCFVAGRDALGDIHQTKLFLFGKSGHIFQPIIVVIHFDNAISAN